MEYKPGSKFIDFTEADPVVAQALKDIERGKRAFTDWRSTYAKLRSAYDKTFEIEHISKEESKTRPNLFRSALGRIQTEVFKKGVVRPEVEISPVLELPGLENVDALSEEQIEEMEKANMAKAIHEWFIRESKRNAVFNRGKEDWFGFGNNVSRPSYRQSGNGKKRPTFENMQADMVILDPDASLIDSDEPAAEAQFFYAVRILTEEMVITEYGEEILPYIQPNGRIFDITEFIDVAESGADYYLEFYGQNKARKHDVAMLGGGMFPVRRYSKKEFTTPPKCKTSAEKLLKEIPKLDHHDKYIYEDSYGDPYLNLIQRHCYKKKNSPYHYGIQQKVYSIQALQEQIENGIADNFRQGLDALVYVTNMRQNQLDQAYKRYRREKKSDIGTMMSIPPTYGQQPPSVGSVEHPQINPVTSSQIQSTNTRLARNTIGVDPDRLEVQTAEGLGVREMLMEEKTETIQEVVDDNLLSEEKEVEKIINFVIAHKGLGLNNVFLRYEGIDMSPADKVKFTRKKAKSVVEMAKELKGWNYQVIVSTDNSVKKSNAILTERIFSFLERIDPNAYPELYKKLIIKLNEFLHLNISSKDLVQEAPAEAIGGASQFKPQPGGGAVPNQAAGGLSVQGGPVQASAPAAIDGGLGLGGQQTGPQL